ncbi:hypothetical protein ACFWP7_28705 [Streptomyces sp. NPDC058470]|uniref:hypothetical protein n=1 Tax=Streptomyces sp. NPDC058470 TaxID=3346515 RepID=UPI003658EE08
MLTMTEAFASAVVAVAPVVLLIGVVEISLSGRKFLASYSEHADLVERRVALIPSNNADDAERARSEIDELYTRAPRIRSPLGTLAVFAGWLIGAMCQYEAFQRALSWLGTPDAGPSPGDARFCFLALSFGLSWVTLLPLLQVMASHLRISNRTRRAQRQLDAFLDATDSAREPTQSPQS